MNEFQRGARAAEARVGPHDVWPAALGEEFGSQVYLLLGLLARLPKDRFLVACKEGLEKIGHLESVGPIFDPSAWVGGTRFENARAMKSTIESLQMIRSSLPDLSGEESE